MFSGIWKFQNFIIISLPQRYTLFTFKTIVMIIVHDIFICKPGNASKVAKLFKEVMAAQPELVNIMTDLTGDFNKVVMVSKYDSLTAYEQNFQKFMQMQSKTLRRCRKKFRRKSENSLQTNFWKKVDNL